MSKKVAMYVPSDGGEPIEVTGMVGVQRILARIEQGKCTPRFATMFLTMTPEQRQASAARIEALVQKKRSEIRSQR